MATVFKSICNTFDLEYFSGEQRQLPDNFDIFFQSHSKFELNKIKLKYRGLHLIRDP